MSDDDSLRTTIRDRIAQRVASARGALGLTQQEVATRAGMPQSTIGRVETSAQDTSLVTLARIAEALETSLPGLIGGGPSIPMIGTIGEDGALHHATVGGARGVLTPHLTLCDSRWRAVRVDAAFDPLAPFGSMVILGPEVEPYAGHVLRAALIYPRAGAVRLVVFERDIHETRSGRLRFDVRSPSVRDLWRQGGVEIESLRPVEHILYPGAAEVDP